MSKRNVALILAGAAVLLVGGGLFASNMGFKLNLQLKSTGTASGTNTIGLPFNRQIGLNNGFQLIQDINNTGVPTNGVVNLAFYSSSTDGTSLYAGGPTDPPAPALEDARGLFVKVNTDVAYVIVGSDNPGLTVQFPGPGSSASGTSMYNVPYHTTAGNLYGLIQDINTNSVPTDSVVNLGVFDDGTDGTSLYAGGPTDPPSPPLEIGRSYFVKVTTDVSYNPSHY
jgi:hypothetical protein